MAGKLNRTRPRSGGDTFEGTKNNKTFFVNSLSLQLAKMTAEDEQKAEAVTEAEAAEEEIEEELEVSSLKILAVTHELHQKHGLRHGDYQRYRGYCARRIARVRKAIKMVQGEKKKFIKKVSWLQIMSNSLLREPKYLYRTAGRGQRCRREGHQGPPNPADDGGARLGVRNAAQV